MTFRGKREETSNRIVMEEKFIVEDSLEYLFLSAQLLGKAKTLATASLHLKLKEF